jgi:hypothetical protein
MSYDLNTLVTARDNLLLAEMAAWVHDIGKCADAFYQPGGVGFNANSCIGNPRVNPHKAVFSDTDLRKLQYWSFLTPNLGQCARLQEALHLRRCGELYKDIIYHFQIGRSNLRVLEMEIFSKYFFGADR